MAKRVWLKVSRDEYELPVAIANTAKELSKICGVTENHIYTSMSHAKKGTIPHTPYICVEVDEEDKDV